MRHSTYPSPSLASPATMELFAIHGFSKLWLMTPGSPPIPPIRRFLFCGHVWEVTVWPSEFSKGVPTCVHVWVSLRDNWKRSYASSRFSVSIEILDNTWERTVFHEVGRGDARLLLKKSELELTSCVDHNDDIPVRCTLTFIKKQHKTRSKWWCQLTTLLAPKSSSNQLSETSMPPMMAADNTPSTIRHLITIPSYSKLAQTASQLIVRTFHFLGHGWSIRLLPNTDPIAIAAMRHSSDSESGDIFVRHPDSRIDVAIEILDKTHKHALFYNKKQMLGDGKLWSIAFLMVNKTELEASSCLNEEDSFTITCTLVFQQGQDKDTIRTIPDESDSVSTPLLWTTDESDSLCTPLLRSTTPTSQIQPPLLC